MPDPPRTPHWERAFSTLGCPDADVHEVARLARTHGCTGVELRCAPPEGLLTPHSSPAERASVKAHLASAGVRALWLASYVRVADDGIEDTDCRTRLDALLTLAADLGALGVRVFPGASRPGPEADERAARRLRAAADRAARAGTHLLLETHDSHPGAADVARVLTAVDHPAVGAVWDVLHTWRAGESPAESARVLAPWLRHVQLKDVAARDDPHPRLPGTGAVPLAELPGALAAVGYRGWLCLEWEKRWFPRAPALTEALRYAARDEFTQVARGPGAASPSPERTRNP
ncbi:sugar phosphate isomerase/epimerase family protein [Streptomyces sp. NPDC090106]|uniref:sugar phosphate isomerase/epimerase family protein n=1 Tax=Streptomyces sp. NPDC090106 TaxID=3365946 RepID=UPI003807B6DE